MSLALGDQEKDATTIRLHNTAKTHLEHKTKTLLYMWSSPFHISFTVRNPRNHSHNNLKHISKLKLFKAYTAKDLQNYPFFHKKLKTKQQLQHHLSSIIIINFHRKITCKFKTKNKYFNINIKAHTKLYNPTFITTSIMFST